MTALRYGGGGRARFEEFVKSLQEDASKVYAVYRMVLCLGGRYAAPLGDVGNSHTSTGQTSEGGKEEAMRQKNWPQITSAFPIRLEEGAILGLMLAPQS